MEWMALFLVAFSIYKADNISSDLGVRLQTRGTLLLHESKADYGFSIRRARLLFSGDFFNFKYKFESSFEGSNAALLDFEVQRELVENIAIRFGQYKVPFMRERLSSSAELELVDRSFIEKLFSLERDIGTDLIFGDRKKWALHLGTFTGWGKNLKDIKENKNLLYVFRFVAAPEGKIEYGQTNLKREKLVNVGVFGSVFPVSAAEVNKMVKKSETTEIISDLILYKVKDTQLARAGTLVHGGADVKVWYDIFGLEIEGILGSFLRHDGSRNFGGARIQPSLMLTDEVGIVGRYSFASIKEEKPKMEVTAGPSYYIRGHNLKLQGDYTAFFDGGKLKNHMIRVQMQIYVK